MTMLEKAARALHAHWYENYDHGPAERANKAWESLDEKQRAYAYGHARAVLMAVRDGSPEMFAAMERAQSLWPSAQCDNRLELERSANEPRVRAMIDAILSEKA